MLSVLSHFSRVWLCDPMACSPPGSSVHGILRARIVEWVAVLSSSVSFVSPTGRQVFFTTSATWETSVSIVKVLVAQWCLTVCNPMDCSLLGFFVRGIFQARILELVVISFSRDLPDSGIKPGFPALKANSLLSEPSISMGHSKNISKREVCTKTSLLQETI